MKKIDGNFHVIISNFMAFLVGTIISTISRSIICCCFQARGVSARSGNARLWTLREPRAPPRWRSKHWKLQLLRKRGTTWSRSWMWWKCSMTTLIPMWSDWWAAALQVLTKVENISSKLQKQFYFTVNFSEQILLIMEYVTKGKLQDFLRKSRAEQDYGNLHGM